MSRRFANAKKYDGTEPVVKKLRELQNKLDDILVNQDETFALLTTLNLSKTVNVRESKFFPMKGTDDLWILDEALADNNNKYILLMTQILKPTGVVQPLKNNFHLLFGREILRQFNFGGISNKEPFKQFKNINRAIFDIQQQNGYTPVEYIKEIREAFRLCKNRFSTYTHKEKSRQ